MASVVDRYSERSIAAVSCDPPSARGLVDHLAREMAAFRGPARLPDDITLLCLERLSNNLESTGRGRTA